MPSDREPKPLRVVLTQPCLPRYRVPVYRALAQRPGIDLTVVYGTEAGITNVEPDGFRAIHTPMRELSVCSSIIRFHRAQWDYASSAKADVLILSWSTRYATLMPALVRANWSNVGTVLWGHGYSKSETTIRYRSRRALSDLADAVMFYNQTAASEHVAAGGASDRAFVALNSLDQSETTASRNAWLSDPPRLAAFRDEHKLRGPLLLFVSRLYAANKLDILLEAAAKLLPEHPDLTVAIIGSGSEEAPLRALAEKLGIVHAVRFLGAIYGEDKLAPWFMCAQAFAYPANIGLSILHAFGHGLPVVTAAGNDSQGPEIDSLRDGFNGLTYPRGSVDGFADALRRILRDPELQRHLAANALTTATREFTLDRMVDGMEAAIRYAALCRDARA